MHVPQQRQQKQEGTNDMKKTTVYENTHTGKGRRHLMLHTFRIDAIHDRTGHIVGFMTVSCHRTVRASLATCRTNRRAFRTYMAVRDGLDFIRSIVSREATATA